MFLAISQPPVCEGFDCIVYNVRFSVHWMVNNVHCTIYNVQCTLYIVHYLKYRGSFTRTLLRI